MSKRPVFLHLIIIIWREYLASFRQKIHGNKPCASAAEAISSTLTLYFTSPLSVFAPPMLNFKKCKSDLKKLLKACRGLQREVVGERTEGILLDLCGSELCDGFRHLSVCIFSLTQAEQHWKLLH